MRGPGEGNTNFLVSPSTASLTEHVRSFDLGAYLTAAAWLVGTAAFALGDGAVVIEREADLTRVEAHPDGAVLVAAGDGKRLVTGGDDGRVVSVSGDGGVETIANEKGRWIDALAIAPSGAVAWSSGQRVTARDDKGRERQLKTPSTVQGLAFGPRGYRLALSFYNGASLWFPNTEAQPEALFWKGSHVDITWSPDGRFLMTSMQENTLHGWRLADRKDLRMAGYPGKTRSFSWSHDGLWLATSGAEAAIVWPFDGKDGPLGKPPREGGARQVKVSRVAFHPKVLVLAVGYEDGCLLLIRLTDASELLVRPPAAGAITALAWDGEGGRLAFGCDNGAAGVLELPLGGALG